MVADFGYFSSQIGHCHSRDSFKKQQNLQRAMEEAKRLSTKTPSDTISRIPTPIDLPDMTGSHIVHLVRDNISDVETTLTVGNIII